MPVTSQLKTISVNKAIAAAENYAADDVLSEHVSSGTHWLFAQIADADGGSGRIIRAEVLWETIGLTCAFTLYLFNAAPTSELNDNVANTAPIFADLGIYVGHIDFPAMDNQGGMSAAIVVEGSGNLPLPFECASGADDLFGIVVCQGTIAAEIDDDQLTIRLTRELK